MDDAEPRIEDGQLESALIVPVRLPPAIAATRLRETFDAPLGVPGHVTLLYPFAPPAAIDAGVLDQVSAVVGAAPAFVARFREVRRFEPGPGASEGVVWLHPEPSARFIALIDALTAAFPQYPPYGGQHTTVIPHVSIAALDRNHAAAAEAEARRYLPFQRRVVVATLIVEGRDGRWRTRRRFRLGSAAEG